MSEREPGRPFAWEREMAWENARPKLNGSVEEDRARRYVVEVMAGGKRAVWEPPDGWPPPADPRECHAWMVERFGPGCLSVAEMALFWGKPTSEVLELLRVLAEACRE